MRASCAATATRASTAYGWVPGGLFLLRSSALQRIQRQLAEMLLSLKPHLSPYRYQKGCNAGHSGALGQSAGSSDRAPAKPRCPPPELERSLKNQAMRCPARGVNVRRLDHLNLLASDVTRSACSSRTSSGCASPRKSCSTAAPKQASG
jgi:hypothetical protein